MNLGEASVNHVEQAIQNEFVYIFGEKGVIKPSHRLNTVEWFESQNPKEVYPVLIVEPLDKDKKNNLTCLCPPFDTSKYTE